MHSASTRASESELAGWIDLQRSAGTPRWGFFLRAETMHGFYSYLEANPDPNGREPRFHELSHGESFLAILRTRFNSPGLYCLDEPEAAMSFSAQLALMGTVQDLVNAGPPNCCVPRIRRCSRRCPEQKSSNSAPGDCARRRTTTELELVTHWKRFLAEPMRYLRHVL